PGRRRGRSGRGGPGSFACHAPPGRTPETQWLIERGLPLVVRANTPLALYAAAASGAGICPAALIFARGLERVLPEVDLPSREIWLVAHREVARLGRVRALHAFLNQLLLAAPSGHAG